MKKLTPYYAYRIYLTIKQHFRGYFLYKTKNKNFLRPKESSFYNSRQYFLFNHLTEYKIKSEEDWISICIVSHLKDKNIYIREIAEQYKYFLKLANDWMALQNTMSYNLEKDITKIIRSMFSEGITFDKHFGKWLLNYFTSYKIRVETFAFLLKALKIDLDGDIDYEYLFKEPFERYILLLDYDESKVKSILEKVIKNEKEVYHV